MATPKTIILAPISLDKSRLVETKTSVKMSSILQQVAIDNNSMRARKRQRLDHLSTEEKVLRRKLKNRVAAQSARDRKKARMDDLEIEVEKLHMKTEKLLNEVNRLSNKNEVLEKENEELRKRLSSVDLLITIKTAPETTQSSCKDGLSHESLEYAEGTGQVSGYSLDDALRWLADVEPDQLMDVLQELTEQLDEPDNICTDIDFKQTNNIENTENCTNSRMVGTTTEQLESDRKNIKSDHEYGKPCESENLIIVPQSNDDSEFVSEVILEEDGSIIKNSDNIDEQMDISITVTAPLSPAITTADILSDLADENFYEAENDVKFTLNPKSPFSDSDYESGSSIYSPLSSIEPSDNYLLDEQSPSWEESFQELFPTLL